MNDDIAKLITTTTRKIRENFALYSIQQAIIDLVDELQTKHRAETGIPVSKPLAVGLTNEQLVDFYAKWNDGTFFDAYETWAKSQTWAFQPNWSNAPLAAAEFTVTGNWYNKSGTRLGGFHISRTARPQEIPTIVVGQTWKNQHGEFEIIAVSSQQVVRADSAGGFMITSIKTFLDNFERVR
jgi:hypothetical protein